MLKPLYVITGDEILLVNEQIDKLRALANDSGYTDKLSLSLDSRSDWSQILSAGQNLSLFNEKKLIIAQIPTGRPGKNGSDTIIKLVNQYQNQEISDVCTIFVLPRLDNATRKTKWVATLLNAAVEIKIDSINRMALPQWINQRLQKQNQSLSQQSLQWLTEKVEGNLLAAHQEIQKLAMLYPTGEISQENLEQAVLDVSRYNVFDLRDAMLNGDAKRVVTVINGLRGEGTPLPLVLWAVGEEARTLAVLSAAKSTGNLQQQLQKQRIFYQRKDLVLKAINRISPEKWPAIVRHAHDIDRLIKGLPTDGRMLDPWSELSRLALRIAYR